MEAFQLRILAEDREFFDGPCVSMVVPSMDGNFGILAHHCNTIVALIPGELHFTPEGEETRFAAVSGGLVKIEENTVLVLTDSVERPEDIDEERALREAEEAREVLRHEEEGWREHLAAKTTLARATNRLKVKHDAERRHR